jgi:hypothetical protein
MQRRLEMLQGGSRVVCLICCDAQGHVIGYSLGVEGCDAGSRPAGYQDDFPDSV